MCGFLRLFVHSLWLLFFWFFKLCVFCYDVYENDEDIFSVSMLRFDCGRLLMNNDEVMIASLKML